MNQFANLIYRLGHLEQILIDQELAPYRLRMNHARVLNYINHHPGCHQKEVAEFLDYQQASLANLINQLEKWQMLVRKDDPTNGRQKRLFLLPQGKKLLQKTDQVFVHLNKLFVGVDPQTTALLEEKIQFLKKQIREK